MARNEMSEQPKTGFSKYPIVNYNQNLIPEAIAGMKYDKMQVNCGCWRRGHSISSSAGNRWKPLFFSCGGLAEGKVCVPRDLSLMTTLLHWIVPRNWRNEWRLTLRMHKWCRFHIKLLKLRRVWKGTVAKAHIVGTLPAIWYPTFWADQDAITACQGPTGCGTRHRQLHETAMFKDQ